MIRSVSVMGLAALLTAGSFVMVSDDLEDAFDSLKQAESRKDPALIKPELCMVECRKSGGTVS